MTYQQVHPNAQDPEQETILCSERELEQAGFSIEDPPAEEPDDQLAQDPDPGEDSADPLDRLLASPAQSGDLRLSSSALALAQFTERWPIERFERMLELAGALGLTGPRPRQAHTALS